MPTPNYPSDSITENLITQIQNLGGTPTSFGLGELQRLLAELQGSGGAVSFVEVPAGQTFVPGASPPNTRRSTQALTETSNPIPSTSYQDANVRMAFSLPVTPTRFRFRWENYNNDAELGENGAVAITGVWMGLANVAPSNVTNTSWQGDFVSAPTQVGNAQVVGTAGTVAEYTTSWTSNAGLITPHTVMAVSLGINTAASGPAGVNTPVILGASGCYQTSGTGCSLAANAGAATWNAASGSAVFNIPLGDLRIEFEYIGNYPIGLWVGDSLMAGWKGVDAADPISAPGPYCRYPEKVGQRLGHLVQNCGAGGKSLTFAISNSEVGSGSFPSGAHYYTRMWFDGPTSAATMATIPDYAVIELSTNDFNTYTYEETALMKTQYLQLIQTLKVGIGIPRVFALTAPPIPNQRGCWGRNLHTALTGGSSTSIVVESSGPSNLDVLNIAVDSFSTTVNQNVVVNSTNFTGTQTLQLSASTLVQTAGGYAEVGGTGGCIIRYTGFTGSGTSTLLSNVLFVTGTAVTATAGSTTIVGAGLVDIESGADENTLWEEVFVVNGGSATGTATLTVALAGTVQFSHAPGVLVHGVKELMRQRFNQWIRDCPPGIDGVIDISANLEFPYFSPNGTGDAQYGPSAMTLDSNHPYHYAYQSANVHPRGPAWHTAVAAVIAPHLIGL